MPSQGHNEVGGLRDSDGQVLHQDVQTPVLFVQELLSPPVTVETPT